MIKIKVSELVAIAKQHPNYRENVGQEEELKEFGERLKKEGQHTPVRIGTFGDKKFIIGGYRRILASHLAGIEEINATVEEVGSEAEITTLQYKDNADRNNDTWHFRSLAFKNIIGNKTIGEFLSNGSIIFPVGIVKKEDRIEYIKDHLAVADMPAFVHKLMDEGLLREDFKFTQALLLKGIPETIIEENEEEEYNPFDDDEFDEELDQCDGEPPVKEATSTQVSVEAKLRAYIGPKAISNSKLKDFMKSLSNKVPNEVVEFEYADDGKIVANKCSGCDFLSEDAFEKRCNDQTGCLEHKKGVLTALFEAEVKAFIDKFSIPKVEYNYNSDWASCTTFEQLETIKKNILLIKGYALNYQGKINFKIVRQKAAESAAAIIDKKVERVDQNAARKTMKLQSAELQRIFEENYDRVIDANFNILIPLATFMNTYSVSNLDYLIGLTKGNAHNKMWKLFRKLRDGWISPNQAEKIWEASGLGYYEFHSLITGCKGFIHAYNECNVDSFICFDVNRKEIAKISVDKKELEEKKKTIAAEVEKAAAIRENKLAMFSKLLDDLAMTTEDATFEALLNVFKMTQLTIDQMEVKYPELGFRKLAKAADRSKTMLCEVEETTLINFTKTILTL